MSPLAVFTGIIMGSAVTIAIGLAMVLVVFLSLSHEQARVAGEYGSLIKGFALFLALAFASSYAFIGTLRVTRWRWAAQAGTWAVIALIAVHYWPK